MSGPVGTAEADRMAHRRQMAVLPLFIAAAQRSGVARSLSRSIYVARLHVLVATLFCDGKCILTNDEITAAIESQPNEN